MLILDENPTESINNRIHTGHVVVKPLNKTMWFTQLLTSHLTTTSVSGNNVFLNASYVRSSQYEEQLTFPGVFLSFSLNLNSNRWLISENSIIRVSFVHPSIQPSSGITIHVYFSLFLLLVRPGTRHIRHIFSISYLSFCILLLFCIIFPFLFW